MISGRLDALPQVLPLTVQAELRSSHAGETGAVWIYRGVLCLRRQGALRDFAEQHLATERQHLAEFESLSPLYRRSALLPLWRAAGFMTGFLPALVGARAVYATIAAVETFVDQHYQRQLVLLREHNEGGRMEALIGLFEHCRQEELHHRDDAAARLGAPPGLLLRLWTR